MGYAGFELPLYSQGLTLLRLLMKCKSVEEQGRFYVYHIVSIAALLEKLKCVRYYYTKEDNDVHLQKWQTRL